MEIFSTHCDKNQSYNKNIILNIASIASFHKTLKNERL